MSHHRTRRREETLKIKGLHKLLISTFIIIMLFSVQAVQADAVKEALRITATVKGLNGLKLGLLGAIPGCEILVPAGLIEGGIGAVCDLASYFAQDPPVKDVPIVRDVVVSGSGGSPISVRLVSQGTVIDIIGENFEFKTSDNHVLMNGIEAMVSPVSTQERLMVGVPLSLQGQVRIVVANSIGKSASFLITVTSMSVSSGSGEITYAFAQKNKQLLSVLYGYVQVNQQPFIDAGVSPGQLLYNITLEMSYIDSFVSEVLPTLSYSELQQADSIVSQPPDVFSLMDLAIAAMSGGAVGGIVIPIDKLTLLAPYIGLASTAMFGAVATAVYVKHVKYRKEKQ